MPMINDEFNRTCVRLDLDPERSGIFTPGSLTLSIGDSDLRVFNDYAARVAPGTPALDAEQIAGAARRLGRAVGVGNEARFIQIRLRRAGEVRAALADPAWTVEPTAAARMRELVDYLDGPVALIPPDVPAIGDLDRALLVDLAMDGIRGELDEYADFCRYRAGEARRLRVPPDTLDLDRSRWARERAAELQLERLVRRLHASRQGATDAGVEVFRVT